MATGIILTIGRNYGEQTPVTEQEAVVLLDAFGGFGSTRVYATHTAGPFKEQIIGIKSRAMLYSTLEAYTVKLWATTTSTNDLIKGA